MSNLTTVTVDDVTDNFDNQRIPLSVAQRQSLEKKYRYYGAQGVIDYVDRYLFDGDYILVAEDGENLKSQKNDICAYVEGQFWVNNHAHIIKAKDQNDTKYIFYKLNQVNFKNYVTGSAQPKLTKENLNSIILHIHEPKDQKRIANTLSALDAKIVLNNRINVELEAMAKTLYDYWFVQFDFPFDFAQGKPDANGKPYKSSGGTMVYNPTLKREIPDGWTDGTLENLGQIVGGSTPTTTETDNFCKDGTPWITPNDLSDNQGKKFITSGATDVSEVGIKSASLKKYPKGTVLLSSRAPIGYMAIARNELTTNQGFKSFVPNKGYSSAFIYYTVNRSLKAITQYASGSTFKEVSASVLKTVKIVLPQKNVSEKYTAAVSPIFARQDILERENEKLVALRDWLLPMLMNGQVTVK